MRALAAALTVLALASAAAGCRRAPPPPAPPPEPRPIGVAFGAADRAEAMLREAAKALEGRVAGDPEGSFGGRVELRGLASRVGGQDREQLLRVLAEGGCGLVVGMGPEFAQAARRAAAAFPSIGFAVVGAEDGEGDGRGPASADPASAGAAPRGAPSPANLSLLGFAEEESSFLAGVLAGLVASDRPGAKVGFLGGMDSPEVRASDAGFRAGAAYANPALRRPGMILRQYCGRGEEAFSDPATAETIAAVQYKAGAEAIFHAAGASGEGLYEAARKAGKLALGSDSGPAPAAAASGAGAADPLIGSAVKGWSRALLVLSREYLGAGAAAGGYRRLGLAAGLVAFEAGPFAGARTAPRLSAVDEARARVASGEIAVPRDELALADFLRALK